MNAKVVTVEHGTINGHVKEEGISDPRTFISFGTGNGGRMLLSMSPEVAQELEYMLVWQRTGHAPRTLALYEDC